MSKNVKQLSRAIVGGGFPLMYAGDFIPDATGCSGVNPGVTVARTSTGEFTLTLDDPVSDILYVGTELSAPLTVSGVYGVHSDIDETATVVKVRTWETDTGNAGDITGTKVRYLILAKE